MLLTRVLDGWQYNSEQTTKQIPVTFPENSLSNAVFTFQITYYYMSIEIYVKYSAEIKFVFHCILYFSHVKKVVSAL